MTEQEIISNYLNNNTNDMVHGTHPGRIQDLIFNPDEYIMDVDPDIEYDDSRLGLLFTKQFVGAAESFLRDVESSFIVLDRGSKYFVFVAPKEDVENYINTHKAEKDEAFTVCRVVSELSYCMNGMQQDLHKIFSVLSAREKMNFMYLMCDGNIAGNKLDDSQHGFDDMIKQFVLHSIHKIENIESEKDRNSQINKLMDRMVFSPFVWNSRIDFHDKTLGHIKHSTPPNCIVVLSDGSRVNLFDLDSFKDYKIMNGIDISKTNTPIDLSNFRIYENFGCAKAKAPIKFPAYIQGKFICSDYKFKVTKIPDGTIAVDLSRTVRSFAELNQIELPETLTEICLGRSVINNVLKDSSESEQMQRFMSLHPNIIIGDKNKTATAVLDKSVTNVPSKKTQDERTVSVQPPKTHIESKTSEWLTRKEIIALFKNEECFNGVDLDRLVSRATRDSSILTAQKLHNGHSLICAHIDSVPQIKSIMQDILAMDAQRAVAKNKNSNVVTQSDKPDAKKAKIKKEKPIRIKKYIPNYVWRDICNYCNDSSHLIYPVLTSINAVNKIYTKQRVNETVQYIDDKGAIQVLSSLTIKPGKAITQQIGNNNGTRIVWTINPHDKIMVAIAFFETHGTGKLAFQYNDIALPNAAKGYLMDGKTLVDNNAVSNGAYLSVDELLEQYKPNQKVEIVKKSDVVPEQTISDDSKSVEQNSKILQIPEQPHKSKRRRIQPQPVAIPDDLECRINLLTQTLDYKIEQLSFRLIKQKHSPEKQLDIVRKIERIIQDKINLQM